MKRIIQVLCSFFVAATCHAAASGMPGVPNIPLKPGLSYGGFFKNHQPVKIVFAVGQPGPQTKESLINGALVIKYLRAHGYKYKIHYVFYSRAVAIADTFSQKYSSWAPLLRALRKEGVTFSVCHNAMVIFHVKSSDVYPFMKVIPAGILSVAEYEMRGYSPIFNPNTETE